MEVRQVLPVSVEWPYPWRRAWRDQLGSELLKMLKKLKKGGGENPPWIETLRLHVLVGEEAAEEGSGRM